MAVNWISCSISKKCEIVDDWYNFFVPFLLLFAYFYLGFFFLIIGSSNPNCCLIVTFLILSFLDILEDLLRASISVAEEKLDGRYKEGHERKKPK